ncbi:MAG: ankyrin repeat domain-containing protein [Rhizobiaceae bacterium]
MRFLILGFGVLVYLAAANYSLAGEVATAARNGDIETLTRLLDEGAPVDEAGAAHPLHYACLKGQVGAASLLLERGADPNADSILGTPLMIAAKRKSSETVELLLLHGADINLTGGREKRSPLHEAASVGAVETVQLLLDRGADALVRSKLGQPPLHLALKRGHHAAAELLRPQTDWTPPSPPTDADISSADFAVGLDKIGECAGCHGLQKGVSEEGPALWNVFGRAKGSLRGYTYSKAMSAEDGVWDSAELDAFLADPTMAVPGTSMDQMRVPDRATRWALIAYLKTLK